jgi:hypothetical protein
MQGASSMRHHIHQLLLSCATALLLPATLSAAPVTFTQTDLVSSAEDPSLPGGIAFSPTSPFWIADNGSQLHAKTVFIAPLV